MSKDRAGHAVPCAYCRLPVPGAVAEPGTDEAIEPLFCCYGCRLAAEIAQGTGEEAAVRWMLVRVGTAIFLTLNLMVFTMALWTPDVYGPTMKDNKMERAYEDLFRHLSLLSAAPVMLMLGPPLARSAWAGVRAGRPGSDLLVVVGVWAAFLVSMLAVFRGEGPIYFEVACVVLIFVTLGRWLEASGKLHTQQAMDDLAQLMPEEALVLRGAVAESVPVDSIRRDDLLQIRPGDRVACDAIVESGEAATDEQIVTGESRLVPKAPGDKLLGGTLLVEGTLTARAIAPVSESTIARLIDHVRNAREIKGKYARMADRVAAWLLPVALGLSLAAGIGHAWHRDAVHGFLVAMSVLLIACPCAVGLATPLAVWSAMGQAARVGVLFGDGEALERLAEVDVIVFDKTGTLTTGRPALVDSLRSGFRTRPDTGGILAAIASRSSHPLARALTESGIAEIEAPTGLEEIGRIETRPGRGLIASDPVSGDPSFLFGSPALFEDFGIALLPEIADRLEIARNQGLSMLLFHASGPQPAQALFGFDESLRNDTISAIESLRKLKPTPRLIVLTGDHAAAGEKLANSLAIEVLSELSPEAKQAFVRERQAEGHVVAFVGEGYNDAPAMASADVGIALGAGADLTRDNAAVCILGDRIAAVPYVIELSKATVRRIRRNLFWAFFYNIIGLLFAASGLLSPTMAAAIMFVSSVAVVAGSSRTIGQDPVQESHTTITDSAGALAHA
ncbi:heavy metal translocating P-type ATPase [bacterium]|nr:heavy metal translocating P-type ATPase [bacterium]